MPLFHIVFEIQESKRCPLYAKGDKLNLTDRTFSCSEGKETCLILVRDLTELLFTCLNSGIDPYVLADPSVMQNCSGCTGLIKFSAISSMQDEDVEKKEKTDSGIPSGFEMQCEFFEIIPKNKFKEILSSFHLIELNDNAVLISKGELNHNLYLVVEGQIVAEAGGTILGTIEKGELCGEMSYLGADRATATVRTQGPARVLVIDGKRFGELLGNEQKVQSFLASLLAKRLREANAVRQEKFNACMSGNFGDILPTELLQVFHMNQKSGVLRLQLTEGDGQIYFVDGEIVDASFGVLSKEWAFFKMMKEDRGSYSFDPELPSRMKGLAPIGDFMMLLMESARLQDEEGEPSEPPEDFTELEDLGELGKNDEFEDDGELDHFDTFDNLDDLTTLD